MQFLLKIKHEGGIKDFVYVDIFDVFSAKLSNYLRSLFIGYKYWRKREKAKNRLDSLKVKEIEVFINEERIL